MSITVYSGGTFILWDQLFLSLIERFPLLRGSKYISTMAKCVFRSLKCVHNREVYCVLNNIESSVRE